MVFPSIAAPPQAVSPHWEWQSYRGLPYLTCRLLEPFAHGFLTQQFWGQSLEALTAVLDSRSRPYRVKQVHGQSVLTPQEIEQTLLNPDSDRFDRESGWAIADGLMSDGEKQALWVASADCTPALIGDVITGRVAAVHAGWRGTALKIVPVAVQRLLAAGSRLADLRVALGPAIAGEVYQVSETVAAQIGESLISGTPDEILAHLKDLSNSPLFPDPQPGRVRIDVRRANELQLEAIGLTREQIAIAPYCTYQNSQYFFSYRRCREKKVQWSGIVGQGIEG